MKCVNCGSEVDVEYHHVIPKILGGSDNYTNLVPLCYQCHSKLHFGENKKINHSELTKEGLRKARTKEVKYHLVALEEIYEEIKERDFCIDAMDLLDIIFSVPIRGCRS